MATKINAKIIADSVNEFGNRITTYVLTYPRIIHAELLTHRMFSRNAASSRAIPYKKLCEAVKTDTFIPIAWQKDHKGMQGVDYHTGFKVKFLNFLWKTSMRCAVFMSNILSKSNATKQLCNRLLEPYQWYTSIVTATEYDNFFELRSPQYEIFNKENELVKFKSKKDAMSNCTHPNQDESYWRATNKGQAEIHLMALAESMWDAKNESTPQQLKGGDWHIPFGTYKAADVGTLSLEDMIKIATARCARVSYTVVGEENKEPNYDHDLKLHDRLLLSGHFSPFEHCAEAMSKESKFSGNFKGFIQYRKSLEIKEEKKNEEPLIATRYNLDK